MRPGTPAASPLLVSEASPRRSTTHNVLVVEMETYLVVFDAPIDERLFEWAIRAAKQRYPGKPIKYLMLTTRPTLMPCAGSASSIERTTSAKRTVTRLRSPLSALPDARIFSTRCRGV